MLCCLKEFPLPLMMRHLKDEVLDNNFSYSLVLSFKPIPATIAPGDNKPPKRYRNLNGFIILVDIAQ